MIIYSVYGEKRDKVVLIRQYRYTIGGYIYEFPAGLVEPGEDFHEGAVREMFEETGLESWSRSRLRRLLRSLIFDDWDDG